MAPFRFALAVCALFVAGPLAAKPEQSAEYRKTANGEFLFKHYPPRALAAREEGRVGFRVSQARDGTPTSCEVTQSSGYPKLDQETCEFITRYGHFAPTRTADGEAVAATHDGVVNWKLPPRVAAQGKSRQPIRSAAADPEKIICTREARTGSLVATERHCMTRRERATRTDRAKDHFGRFIGKGGSWDTTPQ